MYSLTFAQLSGLTIHYRRDYLRRRPIYNVTLGYVMGHAVSREGTTVGKQPTHFQGHPGSGSYCRRSLSTKSRPLEFYPGLT